jgi:DNA uptake protein ComE-like DNA-binding protein
MLDALERRFRRAHPGSVLILVVALLVLLALLGTAYINTARSDRYSSSQNSFNTEVELLLQGLENVTQGTVANGLFNAAFHQDSTTSPAPQIPVGVTDYPLNKPSAFLADRYPTLPSLASAANSTNNFPMWGNISTLPIVPTVGFESPYVNGPTYPLNYHTRTKMFPTSINISYTGSTGTTTQSFPALTDGTYTYLAADTDGDGMADAALFRLPIGELNGITYYAAVRIIDNGAAINAAIAWMPNIIPFVPSPPSLPGEFFPTNIDLYDLVVTADQSNFTGSFANDRYSGLSPTPFDDTGTQRNDFTFGSPFEAFWMQVGRRLANPGYYSATQQYTALPVSEMATMARRFIIRDPSVTSAASSSSVLERDLPNSVFSSAASSAYAPSDAVNWYSHNFDFVTGGMPIRSMLVTQNGVSNFTYSKLHSTGTTVTTGAIAGPGGSPGITSVTAGAWNAGTKYNFGDWVTYTDTNSVTRSYVCMQQNANQPPQTGVSTAYWEPQPWTTGPTKASANTATFGQLWTAYYSAMTETPITATSLGTVTQAAHNAMFQTSLRTTQPPNWDPPGTSGEVPNAGTPGFPQLQLRAAIAAINTLQLRNPNSASGSAAPLSATINLADANGNPAYQAIVYGSAPQPYITEVYANTQGGPDQYFVAIELYNPYSVDITMTHWQLATIDRVGTPGSLMATPLASTNAWATTPPVIKAGGFLVLTSSASTLPTGIAPNSFTASGASLIELPDLVTALNNELVLLRPPPATAPPSRWAVTVGLTATAPVDSYNFTGLPGPDNTIGYDWHYIRPNDPKTNKAWHFVYPGPYSGDGTATSPRQAGTMVLAGKTPQISSMATFGAPDAATAVPPAINPNSYIDRPLQINNTAFGGPNKPPLSPNTFPYGGFARNADLLQVTYVGAYQITDTAGDLLELNALPADSAMADDSNHLSNDLNAVISEQLGRQNIGRFCPVLWADTLAGPPYAPRFGSELLAFQATQPVGMNSAAYPYVPDDYWTQDTSLQTGYHWTFRLFDYVTVQSPQDDYLPDVDPAQTPTKVYPGPAPQPVANVNTAIANASVSNKPPSATEETVPVHGRININTANWRVLATLPIFDNPYNQAVANNLAQAIVYYRDVDDGSMGGAPMHPHGAFQSVGELNNVPGFRTSFGQYNGNFVVSGPHGNNIDGDLSPNSATLGADQVYGDFENQNLALNRISNLITTRSDSFTAYVIVQGWRNAGTQTPQLVVQRRAAFIIDRSTLTSANNTQPAITNVPY